MDEDSKESLPHEIEGKVKEVAGWAAGDRDVEAEGRAEQEEGESPEPAEVDDEKQEVRREHGDI